VAGRSVPEYRAPASPVSHSDRPGVVLRARPWPLGAQLLEPRNLGCCCRPRARVLLLQR